MFSAPLNELDDGRVLHHRLERDGGPVSYGRVIELWAESPEFRAFFIETLAAAPFTAFRWETPPVNTATLGRPFEYVVVDSAWLDVPPDSSPFDAYFTAASLAVVFPNLGRDAVIVAPCPAGDGPGYGHVASFLRLAPPPALHELWRKVGLAMQARIGSTPVWLSTAGGGVDWLHVRLDDRPKYYDHGPYRRLA